MGVGVIPPRMNEGLPAGLACPQVPTRAVARGGTVPSEPGPLPCCPEKTYVPELRVDLVVTGDGAVLSGTYDLFFVDAYAWSSGIISVGGFAFDLVVACYFDDVSGAFGWFCKVNVSDDTLGPGSESSSTTDPDMPKNAGGTCQPVDINFGPRALAPQTPGPGGVLYGPSGDVTVRAYEP